MQSTNLVDQISESRLWSRNVIEEATRFLTQPSDKVRPRILETLTPKLVLFSLCQVASLSFIISHRIIASST